MPEDMKSVEVRTKLIDALRLDLVGPSDGLGDTNEVLPQAPSRWYLTGFLVPLEAAPTQKTDDQNTDELDQAGHNSQQKKDQVKKVRPKGFIEKVSNGVSRSRRYRQQNGKPRIGPHLVEERPFALGH